jgi:hypothetical protein
MLSLETPSIPAGLELVHTLEGHASELCSLAWLPDGRRLILGARDGFLIIWDAASGTELRRFQVDAGPVNSLAPTPEGKRVAVAIRAATVFLGPHGLGHWQEFEQAGFLQHFLRRRCPVIPVILPSCTEAPEVSAFLENMAWVDFRKQSPAPLERLLWGITGPRSTAVPS